MENSNQEPKTENSEPKTEYQGVHQPHVETKKPEPTIVKEIHHHHHDGRGFNPGSMLIGLLIIVLGVAFLGKNAGWFNFSFTFDWNVIWPVLLILVGLSFFNRRGWVSGTIGAVITVLVVALVAWMVFGGTTTRETTTDQLNFVKKADVTQSVVNVKTGAGKLTIGGDASALITGTFISNNLSLSQTETLADGVQTTTLETKGSGKWTINHRNEMNLKLSNEIPTTVNLDTGAMDMTLDLTNLMARTVDVDTGASTLNLTMGDKLDQADVKVKAGASSITVTLPKTVGAKLNLDIGATSKNFLDFNKIDEKTYESTNYSSAKKKINLDFGLGATSLTVNWK
jgi:hypothetical protein